MVDLWVEDDFVPIYESDSEVDSMPSLDKISITSSPSSVFLTSSASASTQLANANLNSDDSQEESEEETRRQALGKKRALAKAKYQDENEHSPKAKRLCISPEPAAPYRYKFPITNRWMGHEVDTVENIFNRISALRNLALMSDLDAENLETACASTQLLLLSQMENWHSDLDQMCSLSENVEQLPEFQLFSTSLQVFVDALERIDEQSCAISWLKRWKTTGDVSMLLQLNSLWKFMASNSSLDVATEHKHLVELAEPIRLCAEMQLFGYTKEFELKVSIPAAMKYASSVDLRITSDVSGVLRLGGRFDSPWRTCYNTTASMACKQEVITLAMDSEAPDFFTWCAKLAEIDGHDIPTFEIIRVIL